MSPEQLIKQLEVIGIDAKVLEKIRRQVEEHNQHSLKSVKPKAILKYLLQKGIINESEAEGLLQNAEVSVSAGAQPPDGDDILDLIDGVMPMASSQSDPKPPETIRPTQRAELDKEPGSAGVEDKPSSKRKLRKPDRKKDATPKIDAKAETVHDPDLLKDYLNPTPETQYEQGFAGFEEAEVATTSSAISGSFRGKRDKRNQWATKWLYIAFTIIGLLAIFGVVLAFATMGLSADEKYRVAKESFDRLSYMDAAKKFEDYYTSHPRHKHVPFAKAYYVQSLIASHYQNKSYEEAIRTADRLLPGLLNEEQSKIDELRDDLAVVLPRSLFLVTEEAKKAYQLEDLKRELQRCENLKKVIDNSAYIPTSQRNKPTTADYLTRIENNIKALNTQIDKEEQYQKAIADIKELGVALKTDEAFAIYRRLTRNFGDLASRAELQQVIQKVSLQEQQLVKPIEAPFEVSNVNRISPIKHSYVLSRNNGSMVESLQDETFCFLVDGAVYGMRGSDGAIMWRRFVGYQSEIQPILIDRNRLLICDLQDFDLVMAERESGELLWRLEIGEPFWAPVVQDSMIIVSTKAGRILKINPASGQVDQAVQLPQPVSAPPLVAEREPYIYQPGSYSNLYVLGKDDLLCREVFYLGHEPGSVAVPPIYWSGFVVVAVNGGNSCDLWVLRPEENGLNLTQTQTMRVFTDGIVTYPLQRYGSWILVSGEQGRLQILELLTSEADQSAPVVRFATERFENNGATTFLVTEGNNLWIAGLELSRIKLQRAQAKLSRETISNSRDLFLTPLQRVDDYLFHVRRRRGSGMISASVVDGMKLEPVWRVDFGGVVPGPPLALGNGLTAISNQGDLFQITADGSANVQPSSIGSRTVESLKFKYVVPVGDAALAAIGVSGQREMVYGKNGDGVLVAIASPGETASCRPLPIAGHLIVPSSQGPIVRVDPTNGRMVGTPFMPPISAGKQTRWLEPVLLSENRFAIAHQATEGSGSMLYLISAESENLLSQIHSLTPPLSFKSRIDADQDTVFGALDGDKLDQLVAISVDRGSILKQVELTGKVLEGPWLVEGNLLVRMTNDQMLMFDKSLAQVWSLSLPTDQFAGQPEMLDGQLVLTFQNGRLLAVEPNTGKINREFDLRQPLSSPLIRVGQRFFCSGMDGTVHEVDLTRAAEAN